MPEDESLDVMCDGNNECFRAEAELTALRSQIEALVSKWKADAREQNRRAAQASVDGLTLTPPFRMGVAIGRKLCAEELSLLLQARTETDTTVQDSPCP